MERKIPEQVKNELKKLAKEQGLEYIENQIVPYTKEQFDEAYPTEFSFDDTKEIVTEYENIFYTMDNY